MLNAENRTKSIELYNRVILLLLAKKALLLDNRMEVEDMMKNAMCIAAATAILSGNDSDLAKVDDRSIDIAPAMEEFSEWIERSLPALREQAEKERAAAKGDAYKTA